MSLTERIEQFYVRANWVKKEAGTASDVFVGGTEASPYLEIGTNISATAIPDDIVIFWDQEDAVPESGWTEIVGSGRMVVIYSTASGTGGTSIHTHSISGTLEMSTASDEEGGDSDSNCTKSNHTHNVAAQLSDANSEVYPRAVKWRCFKKNNTTTEYEFPEGAIVMWDQIIAPTGWRTVGEDGHYVRIDTTGLSDPISSIHNHPFDITSDAGGDSLDSGTCTASDITGTMENADMDDWELDYAQFRFIKKIGESNTWEGAPYNP